jgi:alkylation response protein AidB-like acyl-CoA dehydrogenase
MTTGNGTGGWFERARGLAPVVARYRDEGEVGRRLPQPILAAAKAAGFPRLLLPRSLGGEQAPLETALLVAEELARQDGSAGWNLTFVCLSPLFSDYLPVAAARAIFGGGDTVLAGSFAPSGRACRVAGGYRLSGRWSFGSGCQNADWIISSALVVEGEQLVRDPDGGAAPRMFVFPATAIETIDTWQTVGMRGTGSHDYVVADLFVPEEHGFPFAAFFRGPAPRPGLGYPRPFFELGPLCLAAVGLGVARDAVESFTALAATKTPLRASQRLADQATVHERVGRAEALLRAARCYLLATAREVAALPADAPPMVLPARLAAAHAAQSAVEVVNVLYQAAGGTSVYETSRLARCFRDVNTLSHHVQIAPGTFVAAGAWLLNEGAAASA